ncbi:unnamed protein product [Phaedon cochleariae]|uniref:Double jelly roll-like domain-containing protein n=1 Tax=Phaedon cochleariae TaxID=80249 RepID=A0A9P0GPE2_PHACE|nr:unnamed protein product [Phaedon cochleariae]
MGGEQVCMIRKPGITTTMKSMISYGDSNAKFLETVGWGIDSENQPILDKSSHIFSGKLPLKYLMGFAEDYNKGILNVKQELILIIARSFKNCYIGEVDASVEINKIEWKIGHIMPSDKQRLKLLNRLNKSSTAKVKIAYRMWDLYELPSIRETSSDIWAVKTTNSLERPRYIIIGFQNSGNTDNRSKDTTQFIHAGVNNIRLYLNSEVYPYERWNLDFGKKLDAVAYYAYDNFQRSYYGKDMSEPMMSIEEFRKNPLFIIDCSHQPDTLKSSTVDIKLEFETRQSKFPSNTKVECTLIEMSSHQKIDTVLKLELPPSARIKKKITDFSLCILCQEKKNIPLVAPKSYDKAIECIKKRAEWDEMEYVNILCQLSSMSSFSSESLQNKNAKWHSDCYKKCTHKANMGRSERLYQQRLLEPLPSTSNCEEKSRNFILRSELPLYERDKCIFCDKTGSKKDQLRKIATDSAGIRLKKAIEMSHREDLKIRLSDCSDPLDCHARDISYHKMCWNTHVVNILRPKPSDPLTSTCFEGTNVEFVASLRDFLLDGNVTTMGEIENFYQRIASDNGLLAEQRLSRKQLKLFIEEELEYLGIVFSKPKRVNEPQRISLKVSADVALAITEEEYKDAEHDMKILHKASNILRKAVLKCEKWTFTGSFDDVNVEEVVPEEFVSETIRGSIPKGYRPKNPVLNRETATTGRSVTDLWSYKNEDLIWMIAHTSSLSPYVDSDVNEYQDTNCILSNQEQETPTNNLKFTNAVPVWSAFNSITSEKPRKETRICVLPLIDSSPTKVETQLSLMNKLEKVTSNITPGKKTVVTLDLGLYRPILKLSMAKKDISKNWILRPGELHIVMAMLRCIGKFIDGTGLETTLTVLYDETVVSQILSGKCVRRAINAHTSLRLALFKCVFDEFVKDNSVIEENIEPQLNKLLKDLQGEDIEAIKTTHFEVMKVVFTESIQNDTTRMSEKGLQMYSIFKQERIESDTSNLWAPMTKANLYLCSKANKVVSTKVSDSVIQLKADRSLFTRLLIVSRSRPDIDLQQCLSDYEFSAVPRSMFN